MYRLSVMLSKSARISRSQHHRGAGTPTVAVYIAWEAARQHETPGLYMLPVSTTPISLAVDANIAYEIVHTQLVPALKKNTPGKQACVGESKDSPLLPLPPHPW